VRARKQKKLLQPYEAELQACIVGKGASHEVQPQNQDLHQCRNQQVKTFRPGIEVMSPECRKALEDIDGHMSPCIPCK